VSTLVLLTEPACLTAGTYYDTNIRPRSLGDIGNWVSFPSLLVPRQQHSLAVIPVPGNSSLVYLYVFGGRDSNNQVLDSYEYLTLDLRTSPPSLLNGANWTKATFNVFPAHALGGAVVGTHDDVAAIPAGQTWLWLLAGETGSTLDQTVKVRQLFRLL